MNYKEIFKQKLVESIFLDEVKLMDPRLRGTLAGHRLVDEDPRSRGSNATGNKALRRQREANIGKLYSPEGTPESLRVNIGRDVLRRRIAGEAGPSWSAG